MEKLVSLISAHSKKDHILGDNQQGLQLIIQPNESVIAKQELVAYHSPDLEEFMSDTKHALETLLEESKSGSEPSRNNNTVNFSNFGFGKLISNKSFVKYINTSKELQYIGISSAGKVMTIDPDIYNSFFLRSNNIIAYGTNIQLYTLPEINKHLSLLFGQRHQQLDFVILKSSNSSPTSSAIHNLYLQSESKKYKLFIDLLIEKRLGKNESIMIQKDSILGFESSVFFSQKKTNIVNSSNMPSKCPFIEAVGPGLIIFEMSKSKSIVTNKNSSLLMFLFVIILITVSSLLPTYTLNTLKQ